MAGAVGNVREVKLVLLGEAGVGKSSLVLRFVANHFKAYSESTIGCAQAELAVYTSLVHSLCIVYNGSPQYFPHANRHIPRGSCTLVCAYTGRLSCQKLSWWTTRLLSSKYGTPQARRNTTHWLRCIIEGHLQQLWFTTSHAR